MIQHPKQVEIVISQIDAVCTALNTGQARNLETINAGMSAIHAAITGKK